MKLPPMFGPKISSIFRGCESDIYSARFRKPRPCSKVHLGFTCSSDLHLDALCLERFSLSLCVVCSGAAGGYGARGRYHPLPGNCGATSGDKNLWAEEEERAE